MKKWITLTLGTCLIAAALTALPTTAPGTAVLSTAGPSIGSPLFPSFLDLTPAPACSLFGEPVVWLPEVGYECPFGVPYCFRAQQCASYCAGGEPACEFGCCACAS